MENLEPWHFLLAALGIIVTVIGLIVKLNAPTNVTVQELAKRVGRLSVAHHDHVKEVAGEYAKRNEVKEQISDQISRVEKSLNQKLDVVIGLLKKVDRNG